MRRTTHRHQKQVEQPMIYLLLRSRGQVTKVLPSYLTSRRRCRKHDHDLP